MFAGMIICLLLGMIVGYLYARAFVLGSTPASEQEIEEMKLKLAKAESYEKLLKQSVADLQYQLGEEKKARANDQQRSGKS